MGSRFACMERTGTSRSCPSGPARQVAGRHVVGQPAAVGGLVEGVAGRVHGRGVHRQDDGRLAARAGRLKHDYKVTRKGNRDPRDSFENWLTNLLDNTIGKPALANVAVAFEEVEQHVHTPARLKRGAGYPRLDVTNVLVAAPGGRMPGTPSEDLFSEDVRRPRQEVKLSSR